LRATGAIATSGGGGGQGAGANRGGGRVAEARRQEGRKRLVEVVQVGVLGGVRGGWGVGGGCMNIEGRVWPVPNHRVCWGGGWGGGMHHLTQLTHHGLKHAGRRGANTL
jgi:hypothetical protein